MRQDSKAQAAVTLHRFGFAPKPGVLATFSVDPKGALLAELDKAPTELRTGDDLLNSAEAARAAFDFRQEKKSARLVRRVDEEQARRAQTMERNAAAQPEAAKPGAAEAVAAPKPTQQAGVPQEIFREEARARLRAALDADIGFTERLVWFWSNHFCVSADKGPVRSLCGAFEREAIRPHIRGKFSDMLLAVESHPAMLIYLDNARSIGPQSTAGLRRGKGLNENLAREILELHTLGVRTGYTQDDVTNFAKVITGWSVVPFKPNPERGGEFIFNAQLHEPGPQRVIDRDYAAGGVEQGRAVLMRLAEHPATASHIANKLAQHFVSDDPPKSLVERLAQRFRETKGDLGQVSRALVTAPELQDAARAKLRRPGEWIVSYLRATGIHPTEIGSTIEAQNLLGEPLWRPPAPNGFADDNSAWMDGLPRRLELANRFAQRTGELIDPESVAESAFGPLLSRETREALARAESRTQAVALLLMSPEFQRR